VLCQLEEQVRQMMGEFGTFRKFESLLGQLYA
jgi:hypothetical protein